jgi:hypothetical protein
MDLPVSKIDRENYHNKTTDNSHNHFNGEHYIATGTRGEAYAVDAGHLEDDMHAGNVHAG